MTPEQEEAQLRLALANARKLQEKVREAVAGFPPEGHRLKKKLLAAAERTVVNLELALEAFLKEAPTAH